MNLNTKYKGSDRMKWQERFAERMDSLASSVAVSELLKLAEQADVISFAGGLPDPKIFPMEAIQEAMDRVLAGDGPAALNYGPGLGYTLLRDWIAERMLVKERAAASRENILVTSGGVEALHLICMALLEPGDTVVVGAPTYLVALHVFRAHQIKLVSIELDENGFDTEGLEQCLKELDRQGERPKLVYVIPSFQNPSGLTMNMERRHHLIKICERYNLPIVEDHAYADLRFEGEPIAALKSLAPDRVILIQTFSKIFAPGVRLGWVAADSSLIQQLSLCKIGTDTCANTLGQRLVYQYASHGGIDTQISKAVLRYRRKRDVMIKALSEYLSGIVTWSRPGGGFYVWLTLPESFDSEALLRHAIKNEKTAFVAGPVFFADGRGGQHLRLSYSFIAEDQIEEGIRRLAKAIKSQNTY